ncbi:MAPEG family protein [Marinobacter halodurans]|uniref:MAPEG family protein n=1 Tax=Marinobacter halodurans TaxID=2528979 RepID=A0ABY1ZLN2_9GAMM|nr:MAPEG family protein [Marinobacter halodurans]TBW55466.1 MAPEG family protein [Marinobacter halodurans]
MIVPVTAVFAAITAILMLFLALRVSLFRRKLKVGIGDGGQKDIEVAIRAHANLVEYAPIMLILMALGELNGVYVIYVYLVGMLFVVGRLLHAWGFIRSRGGYALGRMFGTLFTWLAVLVMAALTLLNVVQVSL